MRAQDETTLVELEMQIELGLEDPLGPTDATKEVDAANYEYKRTREALHAVVTRDWRQSPPPPPTKKEK